MTTSKVGCEFVDSVRTFSTSLKASTESSVWNCIAHSGIKDENCVSALTSTR